MTALGSGESDVERLLSVHRQLVGRRMTNISPEVLLARLRIHASVLSDVRDEDDRLEELERAFARIRPETEGTDQVANRRGERSNRQEESLEQTLITAYFARGQTGLE